MTKKRAPFDLVTPDVVAVELASYGNTANFYNTYLHELRVHLDRATNAAHAALRRINNGPVTLPNEVLDDEWLDKSALCLPDAMDGEGELELARGALQQVIDARDAVEDAFRLVTRIAGDRLVGRAGAPPSKAHEREVVRSLTLQAQAMGYEVPTEEIQRLIDQITNDHRGIGALSRQVRREKTKPRSTKSKNKQSRK